MVCVAFEVLLNVPAFTKLLFVAALKMPSMNVIGLALLVVSFTTPPDWLVNVTAVAPLPDNLNCPAEPSVTLPALFHSLSCRFTAPVMLVTEVLPVLSVPLPVTVPPLQLNAPFNVRLPALLSVPPDSVSVPLADELPL